MFFYCENLYVCQMYVPKVYSSYALSHICLLDVEVSFSNTYEA